MSPKSSALPLCCFVPSLCLLALSLMASWRLSDCHEGPHEQMDIEQIKTKFDQLKQGNLDSEEEHIREHLESIAKIPEEQMTREQKHFHYFILHDTDKNLKIDGLEILHAMFHRDSTVKWDSKEIVGLVDNLLIERDRNNDGYIDYYEFRTMLSS
ncbi:multiple coagulation factor deficiency protein 2 homolog [Convolutriloba macropyga]|uniref:multiple coagulation factor deficiency protein 2 homolog n=1 Tax=Convolutriloba macropyga TaxID=536237 RepID=UPI003F51D5B3